MKTIGSISVGCHAQWSTPEHALVQYRAVGHAHEYVNMAPKTTRRMKTPLLLLLLLVVGCDEGSMTNKGRVKPHEPVPFFANNESARPLPEGAVSRDAVFPGAIPNDFPFAMTRKDLVRGQERFNIYCSVCHGFVGDGDGMVVQRGFTPPPSFHIDRLRTAPPGHIVSVITNGFGAMYSYSDRVNMDDRWRIAAYIRALQLSQHADPKSLPSQDQQEVSKVQ